MTLYFIGLGLGDETDITLKGLNAIRSCSHLYLESYTSRLQCNIETLEKLYGKKITLADRDLVEKEAENTILKDAKEEDTGFLVIGDPFGATTHTDLYLRAKKENIDVKVINNTSILNAVGITGLELYKFGKVTSIPFENENVKAPYDVLVDNLEKGLHTLFLLDLRPDEEKFLSIRQAIEFLEKNGVTSETKAVACARLGSDSRIIRYGKVEEIKMQDYGKPPYCIIIPADMHFMEEEMLEHWK